MGFQQTVNINTALGIVGELAFDGPKRVTPYILNSSGTPNLVGNAFTVTNNANPDPVQNAGVAGTAQVGGTGPFGGILIDPKLYASFGTTAGGPLAPTLVLPDNSIGYLCNMGYVFVNLPGPANVGDLVTYDPLTGNLNSIAPNATFTAAIAAGGSAGVQDVMTVSAITAGFLAPGALVTGTGIAGGTYIASYGTGKGGTGTYNLTSVNSQTVSSEAMTATNTPAPAFSATASITGTDMNVTAVASGKLAVGQQVFGTGILPNTVITAYGTGVGGTGHYTVNQSQTIGSETITGPADTLINRAVVDIFGGQTAGGVSVIRLTQ